MNFKSLQQRIFDEWNDIKDVEWDDIQECAKEDLVDLKYVLLKLQKHYANKYDYELTTRERVQNYKKVMYNAQACKLNKRIYKNNLLPSVDSIINYYKNRPKLTEYTLNKEIHRIKNYTIYTHDEKFKKITDLSEILTYYTENFKDNDNDDLLWRCANQSLMADIVTSLTTMGFIRPEMGAGMSMEELTLELDFRNNGGGTVRGKCFLNVTMLPIQRPLIGIILEVYLCPSRKIFQAQIKSITPTMH